MFSRWMRLGGRPLGQPARCAASQRSAPRLRPALELLEDRLVPSGLTYEQWQAERIQLDDVAVANVSVSAANTPQPVNQSFGSLIGLDRAFADSSYRGQGESVAIIDTGIDYTHPDLGGGWGKRVIAGYDFVNHDSDPMDDNGHGTHVAGIIGSSSSTYSGVAPNVNLIALKVLDASGSGSFGDIEAALQWVVAHQAQYNIVAVNMSLGSGNYSVNPYAFLDDEFASLDSEGVFVAVAAGNSFYTVGSQVGLAFPASDPAVVSVGAVWSKDFGQVSWMSGARDFTTGPDRIASFSQRSGNLDLMAPGAMITSTYLHGGYQQMAGTSMAAPVVAGAAALVHQALASHGKGADQNAILNILRSTGIIVKDGDDENDNVTNTGLSFPRLDVDAALQAVVGSNNDAAPVLSPIPDQTVNSGGSRTITIQATDANHDPLTYSARLVGQGNNLYDLRQQLGLTYLGSYYLNVWGANEKWLGGAGGVWYCILPNGELRRWAGTMSATLTAANLVATVGTNCYADPSLLWNAQPGPSLPVTLSVIGNQLTVQVAAGYTGSFQIQVTVSDGTHLVSQTFTVSAVRQNTAPVLGPLGDLSIKRGGKATITVSASDTDGDALSFSARALPGNFFAYQLDQKLGLTYKGSYFQNSILGKNEKWMATANPTGYQDWYCILPNGELRRHGGTLAATMSPQNLMAKLDPSYYVNPQLLWNAKLQAAPVVSLKWIGNKLTITPPANYIGTFYVEISVSDGISTTKKTIKVRVA
jgi:subtilisin family serine protease